MAQEDIRTYSADELRAMTDRGDYTPTSPDAPAPEIEEDFWDKAHVVMPPPKIHTGIRLDADMLEWFKTQGKGWQTRMNAVLRSYYESHSHHHHG